MFANLLLAFGCNDFSVELMYTCFLLVLSKVKYVGERSLKVHYNHPLKMFCLAAMKVGWENLETPGKRCLGLTPRFPQDT